MNLAILQLIASLVSTVGAVARANPDLFNHLPLHNGVQHILNVDLPALLGAEATAHIAPDVPVEHEAQPDGGVDVKPALGAPAVAPSSGQGIDMNALAELVAQKLAAKAA